MTPWQYHKERWKHCTQCDLCDRRKQVVLARGDVPCDILFVGEAPGPNENACGKPFRGPAGQLLNDIISQSVRCRDCMMSQEDLDRGNEEHACYGHLPTVAMTNLVACYPRSLDETRSYDPPTVDQIRSCSDRLMEMMMMCEPRLIVAVGKLAEDHVPVVDGVKMISIVHPGKILAHTDESQKGLAVKRCVIAIADAVDEIDW